MTIRTLEPTPVATVGPSSSTAGKHDVTAPTFNFGGMPFIYEHPIPWSMLAKYFEPILQEATQKAISMLLENQKTLEDFIDSALMKVNGGKVYGDLEVAGNTKFLGKITLQADSVFHDAATPVPVALVPVGTIIPYAGDNAPSGWVLCDGQELLIIDYPYLNDVCGIKFNTPAPTAGYFRVPNLKGRVIVGLDSSDADFNTVGETGGAKTVTLTAAQSGLPSHSHGITDVSHSHGITDPTHRHISTATGYEIGSSDWSPSGSATNWGYDVGTDYAATGISVNSGTTGITGTQSVADANASQAHTNVQPYQVFNYIIKY